MESPGGNVLLLIAIILAVAAVLTVLGAFAAAWWDNHPRITVRRGSKSPEFDAEVPGPGSSPTASV